MHDKINKPGGRGGNQLDVTFVGKEGGCDQSGPQDSGGSANQLFLILGFMLFLYFMDKSTYTLLCSWSISLKFFQSLFLNDTIPNQTLGGQMANLDFGLLKIVNLYFFVHIVTCTGKANAKIR